uniref:Uncharacterized protein n=1 Tax=Anguilla anguilla TaxID=7936 RepID=A0A0E9V3F0_ANGAN
MVDSFYGKPTKPDLFCGNIWSGSRTFVWNVASNVT